MKIIYDYEEFINRTKPVRDHLELEDIVPDSLIGIFFPKRLPELMQYCKSHPQYHIMSVLPKQVKVNRAVESAGLYLLAEGDSDPDLWYGLPFNQEHYEELKIYEFDGS